jgi:hypothetical protein
MWILPEKKMCFLANPKTASSSMGHTLHSLGFETIGDQHCIPETSGWRHWPVISKDSWTIFCTVRYHMQVMVSWYLHNTKTPSAPYFGWPFEAFFYAWLDNPKWFRSGQMYWERSPLCNVILRHETLQADFDKLLAEHDLPATQMQVHNVSKRKRDHSEYYSPKSLDYLTEHFKVEMTELGYL